MMPDEVDEWARNAAHTRGVARWRRSSDTDPVPEGIERGCAVCGKDFADWAIVPCVICGRPVCHKCAQLAFGRSFCSQACSEFFFHGEGDDEETE